MALFLKRPIVKVQRVATLAIVATVLIVTLCRPAATHAFSLESEKPETLPKPEAWKDWNSSEEDDEVDGYISFIQKLIAGIVAFVIVVVAVCLILCFCCPICIIAKMRQRRGAVIRTGPGASSNGGTTVTVNLNRSAAPTLQQSPPMVAIPNNYNAAAKPYPVQESVTVVPLLQTQQPVQYPAHHQPMNMGYPPTSAPQYHPQNFELPPPYPGLPRDPETANLPYNPYFTGDNDGPNAPPSK